MEMAVGHGYDVHRVESVAGEGGVVLGGVAIPWDRRIVAHSDGDVVIHALCDALLGAAGLGDIGTHFPDDEAAWADADSRVFLRRVRALCAEGGWTLSNADITVIAEAPRLAPHVSAMRERLGEDLDCPAHRVNVKATTHEGLGAIGRGEGIAACAVVLLRRPDPASR